jgi:hypothetical protein
MYTYLNETKKYIFVEIMPKLKVMYNRGTTGLYPPAGKIKIKNKLLLLPEELRRRPFATGEL